MSNKTTVKIDDNVPLPPRSTFLPDIPLGDMKVGQSCFVEIDYHKQHGAVRQRVYRFKRKNPGTDFNVLKYTEEDGRKGVRIYRHE